MKFNLNKFRRRAIALSLGAFLLCLTFSLTLGWAQEAPRQEGSTQIKPPMIKPPMQNSKNTNSGVNSSRRRKRRSRRHTRSRAKVTSPPVVPTSESILTVSGETRDTDTEASIKPPMENSDSAPVARPSSKPINVGVLNSKALSLPRPIYPPMARAARASGTVTVQVIIDEEGRVISAKAVSGHPLLRGAAVEAAQKARFAPTHLKGQPVQVTGVLYYNF